MNKNYIVLIVILSISFLGCIESKEQLQTSENNDVNLLFIYSPECIHCIRTIPAVDNFREKHSEVNVICVKYNDMTEEQRTISDNTQYVPTMVFYNNNISKKLIKSGEMSLIDLEGMYDSFKL